MLCTWNMRIEWTSTSCWNLTLPGLMYNQPSHEMKCKSQFGKRLNNKHVKILCDNSPINAMGGTKSPSCNQVAYDIRDWCVNNNTWLTATHIAGVENTEADEESWLFSDHTEWALKREIFPQITTHWGIPEIYLFVSWLDTQLPRFVSWKCDPASCFVDAFTLRWDSLYIYAFPPFCQINRCLKKIWRNKYLRESWSYHFGPLKFDGHNFWEW